MRKSTNMNKSLKRKWIMDKTSWFDAGNIWKIVEVFINLARRRKLWALIRNCRVQYTSLYYVDLCMHLCIYSVCCTNEMGFKFQSPHVFETRCRERGLLLMLLRLLAPAGRWHTPNITHALVRVRRCVRAA